MLSGFVLVMVDHIIFEEQTIDLVIKFRGFQHQFWYHFFRFVGFACSRIFGFFPSSLSLRRNIFFKRASFLVRALSTYSIVVQ